MDGPQDMLLFHLALDSSSNTCENLNINLFWEWGTGVLDNQFEFLLQKEAQFIFLSIVLARAFFVSLE